MGGEVWWRWRIGFAAVDVWEEGSGICEGAGEEVEVVCLKLVHCGGGGGRGWLWLAWLTRNSVGEVVVSKSEIYIYIYINSSFSRFTPCISIVVEVTFRNDERAHAH